MVFSFDILPLIAFGICFSYWFLNSVYLSKRYQFHHLIVSMVPLASFWLVLTYTRASIGLGNGALFYTTKTWFAIKYLNLSFDTGFDGLSLTMMLMANVLLPAFVAFTIAHEDPRLRELLVLVYLVHGLCLLSFLMTNFFFFYVCFELLIVPMFFIIGVWGTRQRKKHAAMQFFVYTLVSSILMLGSIIYILVFHGTLDYVFLMTENFSIFEGRILFLALFISFAIKMPLFPFHIWLPEAHSEAPTVGSMILAGVLLKLGGFGLLRFVLPLFPDAALFFSSFVQTMAIVSMLYCSIIAIRQNDIKRVVAYSSIVHMSMATLGIFSGTTIGMGGAVLSMVNHGFISAGLFGCVGLIYRKYGTRNINELGSLSNSRHLSFYFFLFILSNIGFPITGGFIGELFLVVGIGHNSFVLLATCCGFFFNLIYNLWFFSRLCFGKFAKDFVTGHQKDINNELEIVGLVQLVSYSFYLGIFPTHFVLALTHAPGFYWFI